MKYSIEYEYHTLHFNDGGCSCVEHEYNPSEELTYVMDDKEVNGLDISLIEPDRHPSYNGNSIAESGYAQICPECDGIMVDQNMEGDYTHLKCSDCNHELMLENDTYHSDSIDSKIGGLNPRVKDDVLEDIVNRNWNPKVPKRRNELWNLQKHISVFNKAACAYNSRLKDQSDLIAKMSSEDKSTWTQETWSKFKGLCSRRKRKKYVKGIDVFAGYADLYIDKDVKEWVIANWESLNIKDVYEKPELEGLLPVYKDEDGNVVSKEFTEDDLRKLHDYRRYSDADLNLLGYVAYMAIRSPKKCIEKIYGSKARRSIKLHCIDIIDIVEECGIRHPSTQRWINSKRLTKAYLEAEMEELAYYDSII